MSSDVASARRAARRRHRARCRCGDDAELLQRLVQRSGGQVGAQNVAIVGEHGGIFEGDRHAVGQADALHAHDLGIRLQPERVDLLRARRCQTRGHDPRAGDLPTPGHLVAERQEHAGATVHRAAGDERALAAVTIDEPGVGQLLQGLADGHPADGEPGAELRLGGQGVASLGAADQPAQVVLDLPVAGGGRRAR